MSKIPKDLNEPFEVKTIHQLVRLMKKYDLTAIDLIDSETKIRLRRRGPETGGVVYQAVAPAPGQAAPVPAPQAAAPAAVAPTPAAPTNEQIIESPMVGTFYSSPSPDAPPFVSVGGAIRVDTTVCVIEAMKVFTDIPAGIAGTLVETLVKNGQSVEFGQPLFRVRTS